MAQTAQLQGVRFGDGNANCGNITNNAVYNSDEDAQIMRWLSPLEPNNRHQGVRTDRFDGVGDWFLETSEFRKWMGSEGGVDEAVLFCSGNPGVGKTYLSSLVIDTLCDQAKERAIAVACFYCDYKAQQEQVITNVLGAILKQLVGRGDIPDFVRKAFQEGKKEIGGRGLRLPDLVGMLKIAITSLPHVFICVDALDECLPKHLPELLKSLGEIVRESPKTRIFLTGRPQVKEDISRYFTRAVVIPISPKTDDIRNYVERRLSEDSVSGAMNDNLRADIIRIIREKISDIFLLVSLNMDAILGEVTIRQRRKKLEQMIQGNGLGDAYTATLARLKAQKGIKSILGMKVLMWVLFSERPLRANELRHALGVEIGSADLDAENIPAIQTLVASSLGLVTVEASSSTVRLVHFTLQDHLSSDPALFSCPHSTIAEVCLTYLNFECVRDLSPTLFCAPPTMPLLEYASCYWGKHAKREMTESVKILALSLLDRFDEHISVQLMLFRSNKDREHELYFFGARRPTRFTGLHGGAFLGIVEIVAAVLEMKEWDVDATDYTGVTALILAAVGGHEEVVELLLGREAVNPDKADTKYGRTPLSWAAENGHEGVVKMLLQREGVNPDQAATIYGRTPLSWAAENGHEGVVKILLQREGVNPNQADTEYGQTPLLWAALNGHEGVVKMLLQREGVNPNQANTEYGRTPLSWAAENGHDGVVKMLLQRGGVNPDQADTEFGRTPLSWAAENGHEGVVKILLQREGVNPNQADTEYGRTPLAWAARCGQQRIVKILLQREDINPNTAETEYGQTLLSWATENGREWAVKLILERKDVNPNTVDAKYGRTPLSWAAQHAHEGVVGMLLERKDVNPNKADAKYGRTPLSWAAEHGHQGVVRMLLQRRDVNPDAADTKYGPTPLLLAAGRGHKLVVKMLLEREDVNPNAADAMHGRTPLLWAIWHGHEEVVRMLLGRADVHPNRTDTKYGQTPLLLAAARGREGVVEMLLEREGVDPNQPDTECRQTPLLLAAGCGHERVVAMLLERKEVNPNVADTKYGRTPLSWAAWHGHERVVRTILERQDVHTATLDNENQTPLSLAFSKGHDGIVRILHQRGNFGSDTVGPWGRAPPRHLYGVGPCV